LCCIALYLNFLAKLPETKALDIIVVFCAWPYNETGLFHQICCELQHLGLNFGLEDLCTVPETEQIPFCPSGARRTGFPCVESVDGEIIGIRVTDASISIISLSCTTWFMPAPRRGGVKNPPSASTAASERTCIASILCFGVMAELCVFARLLNCFDARTYLCST
jgi:hypothetical protein